MITVYTFDYETGVYIGPQRLTVADCDPQSPGVVLIPGDATLEPPPNCGPGLMPVWRDGQWQVFELVETPDHKTDTADDHWSFWCAS